MDEIIDRLKKVRKGAMFIIEAPSGTGKGTVAKELLRRDPNIKFSVSVTTREPREGEVEGVDYYLLPMNSMTSFWLRTRFTSMLILNTVRVTVRCVRKWTVSSTWDRTCCLTWTGPVPVRCAKRPATTW